jgi:hypothetical protein
MKRISWSTKRLISASQRRTLFHVVGYNEYVNYGEVFFGEIYEMSIQSKEWSTLLDASRRERLACLLHIHSG